MRRKNILFICAISIFLVLSTQPIFAFQSEAWIVDDSGQEVSTYRMVETGSDIDLGKVRLREDNYTLGKLEVGDRITLVLRNAAFSETPLVLDPVPRSDNPQGSSGEFELVRVDGTGRVGDNAVIYELKTKSRYYGTYKNLDYVFYFKHVKVENEGDVYLNIFAGTQDDTLIGPIIKHQEILLAKSYNVLPDSVFKNQLFEHEIISRELNQLFQSSDIYKYSNSYMVVEMPKIFFEKGEMAGTLGDERWTFKLSVNDVNGMRIVNPEFSQEVGLPIREILFYKKDGFMSYPDVLASTNFEPIKVTFKNLNPTSLETSKFVPIKYLEMNDGTYKKEIIGSGTYNNLNKEYTFYVNGPGIYSIEKKEVSKIVMRINDYFASVNNIQERLDVAPMVINNSTYVPVRFIAENLGAQIEFLSTTNQVEIKTADKTIYLPIDQVTTELATPARIIDGRTMVPVRYVSERLGASVSYFADTRRIEIIK